MNTASKSRRPAMRDVAEIAGVSHQTVSRVLNNHPSVRPETRERVLEAIAQIGYRPNTAARALATARSGIVGVITDGSGLFGPTSAMIAIEEAARAASYFVSVATVDTWEYAQMSRALEHFMSQGVEGIVVLASQDEAAQAVRAFADTTPIVMVAAQQAPIGTLRTVGVDQNLGARLATRHLLELGHRHVTHLAGPLDWFDARARLDGWRHELERAGIESGDAIEGDWSADCGYETGLDLANGKLPTAVFAANDQLSLGLLHAFAENGVRVPGDVSLVGFDDIPGADHFWPPLTTVAQRFPRLGRECLRLVLEMIGGNMQPETVPIEPRMVVRSSTAPPRG